MIQQQLEPLVNHLGLVPMKVTTGDFAPYQKGGVAGFPPDEAARLIRLRAAVPVDEDGEEIEIAAEEAPASAPGPAAGVTAASMRTLIPDDWEAAHHLSRLRLAREISGGEVTTVAAADEIIRAEVARRANT